MSTGPLTFSVVITPLASKNDCFPNGLVFSIPCAAAEPAARAVQARNIEHIPRTIAGVMAILCSLWEFPCPLIGFGRVKPAGMGVKNGKRRTRERPTAAMQARDGPGRNSGYHGP